MMKCKKSLFIACLLLSSALSTYTESIGQCMDPIEKYINASIRSKEPETGQQYFMQFTIKSIPAKNSSIATTTVSSKIYRSKNQLVYKTNDVEIFQDQTDALMVVHRLKRIIWGNNLENVQTDKTAELAAIQRLMLTDSEIVYCKNSMDADNHELVKIKLKTSERVREEFKIDFSLMDFDITTNQFLKVENIFSQGQKLQRQIIEYDHLDYNFKGPKLKPAKSMVFNANGELKPEYRHYTIIKN